MSNSLYRVPVIFILLLCLFAGFGCSRISATAEPGGTVVPAGAIWVWHGDNRAFALKPDAGNTIADVKVDGLSEPLWSSSTYTFMNVTANHSIAVSFVTDTVHYRVFNIVYGTTGSRIDRCTLCHRPHSGPIASALTNSYGFDIHAKTGQGYTKYQALKLIEQADSDGDGPDNITEISARTFPGDASDHP